MNYKSILKTHAFILLSCLTALAVASNYPTLTTDPLLSSDKKLYRVAYPSEKLAAKAAISFHVQMLEANYEEGYFIMELNDDDKEKLQSQGFRFEYAPEWEQKINQTQQRMRMINSLREQTDDSFLKLKALPEDFSNSGIPGFPCYETVEETFAKALSFEQKYSNLAEWIDIGDSWEKQNGLGGYDLMVLKLTNKKISGDKPKLFINSAIHAQELATAPLSLAFAEYLLEGYGTDADANWILDHHEIHLLLQNNPDGRKKAEDGYFWRKNTNENYCGFTDNFLGVDLNRNFSFDWNAGGGSSGFECSRTFRGPFPASEPETQAMEAYVRSLYPDRRGPGKNDPAPIDTSGIHLDLHSFSRLVLWPWSDTEQPAPNSQELQTLGRKFAWFNNHFPQQAIGLYPTDGSSYGISYGELGVASYTFELGIRYAQSCWSYKHIIKPNNLPALIYAAKVLRTPYITPAGPDTFDLTVSPSNVAIQHGTVTIAATVSDSRFSTRNGTEASQNIHATEAYIDIPPWQESAQAINLYPNDGNFNEPTEDVYGQIDTSELSKGRHIIFVRGRDEDGNWGAISAVFLTVGE